MSTIIHRTKHGVIVHQIPEDRLIIEFGNMSWRLSFWQFDLLRKFLSNLNIDKQDDPPSTSLLRRRIRIPLKGTNMSVLLNDEELQDLMELINGAKFEKEDQTDIFDQLHLMIENKVEAFQYVQKLKMKEVPIAFHLN